MRFTLIWLAIFLSPLSSASAQQLAPRDIAENVAALIEANFYDENRASEIAEAIRSTSQTGTWDGIDEPFSLAAALTDIIAPYDGHFQVSWTRPGNTSENDELQEGRQLYGFEDRIRRAGYGFRQVSILPGNIGYIDMTNFADIAFDNPQDPAWASANAALALTSAADAVIIDLRDNGGGSPAMVGYLTSAFTAPNAQIYNIFHSRTGTESEAPGVFHPQPRLDVPLYILTSARTGSAGEALPYTLQAASRATIVGEASYGAANPGGGFDAGDGFEVFISTGSPVNPITESNWEGSGVIPDVTIPSEDALRLAQVMAIDSIAETGDAAYRLDREWARAALENSEAPPQDVSGFIGDYGSLSVTSGNAGLTVQRGERPAHLLVSLEPGLFYRSDYPLMRYRFARDDAGNVTALETLYSDGTISRYQRD